MFSNLPANKTSLRAQILAQRTAILPEAARRAGHAASDFLVTAIGDRSAVIAAYRPIRGEIDLSEAYDVLAARGHTLCLPVAEEGRRLVFRRWHPGAALEKGRYGIEVPPAGEPQVTPDVLIVPLLAFDRAGHRLGYGAGYYDRAIRELRAAHPAIRVIGAAFAMQHVDQLPAEAHDERLDTMVTEEGMVTFS